MNATATEGTQSGIRRRRRWLLIAGITFFVVGIGAPVAWLKMPLPDLPARLVMDGGEGNPHLWDLKYSPDGSTIAVASAGGLTLRDAADGRLIKTLPTSPTFATLTFSPDGSMVVVVVGGWGNVDASVWDVATGRQLATLASSNPLVTMRFSPDGRTLNLVVLRDLGKSLEIMRWDAGSWAEPTRIMLPVKGLTHLLGAALSADGTTLALASDDKAGILLWETSGGRPRGPLHLDPGEEWPVFTSLAFSPDGKSLAATGEDRTIMVLDLATGRSRARLRPFTKGINPGRLSFTPDGRALVSSASGWPDHGSQLPELPFGLERLVSRGTRSITLESRFLLWNLDGSVPGVASGAERSRPLPGSNVEIGPSTCFAISPEGRTLATAHGDGKIRLRDISKGR